MGLAQQLAEARTWDRPQKCAYCKDPATRAVFWCEGRAYVPVCGDRHEQKARKVDEVDFVKPIQGPDHHGMQEGRPTVPPGTTGYASRCRPGLGGL